MKILLADDNVTSRRVLEGFLQGWECEYVVAQTGEQALEILHQDGAVSLLIASRDMPGMDGVELCRHARLLDRSCYLHTVLLSPKTENRDLLEIVNKGVDAVLTLPVHPSQLLAHIRVADRIQSLEDRLADRVEELTTVQRRNQEDLEAAARVQRSLLPKERPVVPGADCYWIYEACEFVAGDMFHVHRLDEKRLGLYVLDVSGHGVKAALLAVTLSRLLSPHSQIGGLLKRPLPHPPHYEIPSPAEVVGECNRIFPALGDASFFFTLLYGILDLRDQRFTYGRAGHPGPVHVRGPVARVLEESPGPAIGISPDYQFHEASIQLQPGDKLVLFSDGVEEAMNVQGEEFGRERMLDVLADCHLEGVEASLQEVMRNLREFVRGEIQSDDITLLGVGIR